MKRIYIKEEKTWDSGDLRQMCMRHNLFTRGVNADYYEALHFVDDNEPTIDNIYMLADFILNNSSDNELTNIMFLISNEVVKTYYYEVGVNSNHDLEISEYNIK